MRDGSRPDGIDGDLQVAVGAVLETDRHRQTGAELAVDLAFHGPGADRAPGHRVGDVLRYDRVEELAPDRQAAPEHAEQHLTSPAQARVHVSGAVEMRIVDQ